MIQINEVESNIGGSKILLDKEDTVLYINWKGLIKTGIDRREIYGKKAKVKEGYLQIGDRRIKGRKKRIYLRGEEKGFLWVGKEERVEEERVEEKRVEEERVEEERVEEEIYYRGRLLGYSEEIPSKEIEKFERVRKEKKIITDILDPMAKKGQWERIRNICGMFLDRGENIGGASLYKAQSLIYLKPYRKNKVVYRLISQARRVYTEIDFMEGERRCKEALLEYQNIKKDI